MSNVPKGKLALYWAASCGGCEIAVLAIDEKILDVAALFDIVFWPVAVDAKVHDVEKMADQSIDVCLFNGSIRTSEQEYMARLLRRKSKVLVAFGSCASEGCIPGLANATSRRQIFDTAYHDTPTTENPQRIEPQTKTAVPEGTLHLPAFYETVRTLAQTVPVDYSLPGCPPEAERIWEAILAIVENRLPPPAEKGSRHLLCDDHASTSPAEGPFRKTKADTFSNPTVIGAETTVCDECKRTRNEKKVKKFYRTWQVIPDEETCLLEQGLLCCGIATRAGCGALCPQVNSPCIGCYGPNRGVHDFGARMMAALSSMIDSNEPEEIDRIIRDGIPDPVGSFYRFGLAASHLRRAKRTDGATAARP
jgi:F420-non-reducing hydrogenase small subunit